MSRRERRAVAHDRLVGALRLASGLSWLILALAVFYLPLVGLLGPVTQALGLRLSARPDPGFLLDVTSVPQGGRVVVNGVERGTAPILTNVACNEGQKVTIRVTKEGYPPWERQLRCREDNRLIVRARLKP